MLSADTSVAAKFAYLLARVPQQVGCGLRSKIFGRPVHGEQIATPC